MAEFSELRDETDAARREFLETEISTGMTFAQVARTTNDPVKAERNHGHVREAYETILRIMKPEDEPLIREGLAVLKATVESL